MKKTKYLFVKRSTNLKQVLTYFNNRLSHSIWWWSCWRPKHV